MKTEPEEEEEKGETRETFLARDRMESEGMGKEAQRRKRGRRRKERNWCQREGRGRCLGEGTTSPPFPSQLREWLVVSGL